MRANIDRHTFDRILDNVVGGHVNLGPVTIYGRNAMHFAVNVKTERWGYVCFRLPLFCFGKWWPMYFYCSPNATPWAATFYRGSGRRGRIQREIAEKRFKAFGHNFSTNVHSEYLQAINDTEGL